jgi:putative ABC transport system permease protein
VGAVEYFLPPENLDLADTGNQVIAVRVSSGLLPALGALPIAGRLQVGLDEVVLSYAIQQAILPGAPESAIGRHLRLGPRVLRVAGVLPPGWFFPDRRTGAYVGQTENPSSGTYQFQVQGLLRFPGTLEEAQSRVDVIMSRSQPQRIVRLHPLHSVVLGSQRQALLVVLGAGLMVVLLASINVAHLELNRSVARLPLVAIGLAFGAPPSLPGRRMAARLVLLALLAVSLGTLLAWLTIRTLRALSLQDVYGLERAVVSPSAVGAALIVSVAILFAAGMWPLRQFNKASVIPYLRASAGPNRFGQRSHRGRFLLLVSQLALALTLVALGVLLLITFQKVATVDWGFERHGVTIADFNLPRSVERDLKRESLLAETAVARVRAIPGVEAAAVSDTAPFRLGHWTPSFVWADGEYKVGPSDAALYRIGSGYFDALGTRFIDGNDFGGDAVQVPEAIISSRLARMLWPGQSAVGREFRVMEVAPSHQEGLAERVQREGESVFGLPGILIPSEPFARRVIGVVQDVYMAGLDFQPSAAIYLDHRAPFGGLQLPVRSKRLVVRTRLEPLSLERSMRTAVHEEISGSSIGETHALKDLVDESIGATGSGKLAAVSLVVMGAMAVALSIVGSYATTRAILRSQAFEHGLRIALGATPWRIRWEVSRPLICCAGIATLLAALLIFAGVRLLGAFFVMPIAPLSGPATLCAAGILLSAATATGFALRRLDQVQPSELLR